eukprot:scaffold1102_cov256-Pinguiococcus_pyrenoidosus.AAC.29
MLAFPVFSRYSTVIGTRASAVSGEEVKLFVHKEPHPVVDGRRECVDLRVEGQEIAAPANRDEVLASRCDRIVFAPAEIDRRVDSS